MVEVSGDRPNRSDKGSNDDQNAAGIGNYQYGFGDSDCGLTAEIKAAMMIRMRQALGTIVVWFW